MKQVLKAALDRIVLAEERRAALLELLPYGVPDDWVAVGSAPLFDEYERKLREVGRRLDPKLRQGDIPRLRRQAERCAWRDALPSTRWTRRP